MQGSISGPADEGRDGAALLALIAATTFLSAFLLFQLQPIMARALLPWFGGGATVWLTALFFFQVALLAGYAYSHWLALRLGIARQAWLHVALLAVAAVALPVIPRESFLPVESSDPTRHLLVVLALTAGPPYLLLATTGPLLQRWAALRFPGRSPYPLYALSNAASLLALLTYPVVVEPLLGLRAQAWTWSAGYLVFAGSTAAIAIAIARAPRFAATPASAGQPVPMRAWLLWVALSATATAMLMSTTNALTQDLAAFPLLWVLPLAIYLLTFILAFASDRAYQPVVYLFFFVAACCYALYLLDQQHLPLAWLLMLHSGILFVVCMTLHGEVARRRPEAARLTSFYLALAVGGALGGIFVGVLAPLLFTDFFEMHVTLAVSALLVCALRLRAVRSLSMSTTLFGVGALLLFLVLLGRDAASRQDGVVASDRSFYGVVHVYRDSGTSTGLERLVMEHGGTLHGFQYLASGMAQAPGAYYDVASGAGIAITQHPARAERPLRIAVVGLGVGMLAAFADPGDEWTFVEVNPTVIDLAETEFTYLAAARDRGTAVDVLEGDGRVVIERDLDPSAAFDVIVLDAFTGGAIPTHLLTQEAFGSYRARLAPGGVIAVHVSNRYVRLGPVVRASAEAVGLDAWYRDNPDGPGEQVIASQWVLATSTSVFTDQPEVAALLTPWLDEDRVRWTDDRTDLWRVLEPF